jgi:hypothetical protein
MKRPLPLLFAFMAMAVLLGVGNVMNNACKNAPHGWCAPPPKIRPTATRSQEGDSLIPHAASRVRSLSQR